MNDTALIISEYLEGLKFSDLDEATREQTRMYIADYIAAVYAGYRINQGFNQAVLSLVGEMNGGEDASVLVTGNRFCAENAAFMNAVFAHGADMDDGNRKARGHVAAHVMSAVFALAQTRDVSWEEVAVSIHAGYEVFNRVAAAVQPDLVHRGFHSTGTAGAVACAAACAKLMGMNAEGIYNSMAIGALQASGLIIIAESGQTCKPLNPANAARTGILSAKLSERGVKGPKKPFDSGKGWFHAMADHIDENEITSGLGQTFTMNECYLKPYPSCRHTHCGIEAAIRIRERMQKAGYTLSDLQSVKCFIYPDAIRIAGTITVPESAEDAKFSIAYAIAVALKNKDYCLDDLERPVSDESRNLARMIELIPDKEMEDTKAGIRGAKVSVCFTDGIRYEEQILLPKGEALNPFTWEDMRQKMRSCMKGFYPHEEIDKILHHIRTLDFSGKFGTVLDLAPLPDLPFGKENAKERET